MRNYDRNFGYLNNADSYNAFVIERLFEKEIADEELKKHLFYDELSKKLTPSEIKSLLTKQNITISDEDLHYLLTYMLVRYGELIREDYWTGEPVYTLLDYHHKDSSFSKHYYKFEVNDSNNKKILLLSDTHIGDSQKEDFKLLHNIYDFAIKNGATKCFHCGDLFAGSINGANLTEEEAFRQLKLFIEEYPHPNPNEMMTYANLGNHDEQLNEYFKSRYWWEYFDLRGLTYYDKSFYMFPRTKWITELGDIKLNFSHRFYVSWLIPEYKMNNIAELQNVECWLDDERDVQISGHLHRGIIYSVQPNASEFLTKDKIWLGVPSTSQININSVVGYLVDFHYQDEKVTDMEVSFLIADANRKIYESEHFNWSFQEKNKVYRRVL